jgi:FkbM family methyltransferase
VSLKRHFQRSLQRLGVYERARASWIYDLYWAVLDKQIINNRRNEVAFYRGLLYGFRKGDLVFDLGANQGYKTGIFLELGARVVAVDPDEVSQQVLTQRFLMYRLKAKPLTIVGKAVSYERSTGTMWIDRPGSAKNTLSVKWAEILRGDNKRFGDRIRFDNSKEVDTITLEQLIATHGSPFFVKIDVEGHELSVLRGLQRPIPYLSFEVNLPEFRQEGLECVKVLSDLAADGEFAYSDDCRFGLASYRWFSGEEFSVTLGLCTAASIEVFWRTPLRNRHD